MLTKRRSSAIVGVLTDDKLRNECHEFHFLGPQYLFELICRLVILGRQIDEVTVSVDEGLVTQLILQVDSEGLNAVTPRIRRRNARQCAEHVQNSPLIRWFLKVFKLREEKKMG